MLEQEPELERELEPELERERARAREQELELELERGSINLNQTQRRHTQMTINIDELTLGQVKHLRSLLGGDVAASKRLPMPIGMQILVRTVTHYYTGRVTAVAEEEVEISDACWVADTGRFADALEKGVLNELEPYPEGRKVTLNRGAFVDWCEWPAPLPRTQK